MRCCLSRSYSWRRSKQPDSLPADVPRQSFAVFHRWRRRDSGTRLKGFVFRSVRRIVRRFIMSTFHLILQILLRGVYRAAFCNLNGFAAASHCWPKCFPAISSLIISYAAGKRITSFVLGIRATVKVAHWRAELTKWKHQLRERAQQWSAKLQQHN